MLTEGEVSAISASADSAASFNNGAKSFFPTHRSFQVDMVIIPATPGQMCVLAGHVYEIADEAVPVDQIDPTLVQKGLLLSSPTKAEAQIGVDVHSALNSALSR
ncbi:ATP synthase subunit delta', mitochondrial [Senna tora]|uniref:ATP synthase subunit delta', mitochondrial n=1 Tax=Senna tora TaxID=362788 RepID=A0A834SWH2_9FABA|nr:ATP synthase subunit delta', mitochondrial [Senna tora]